MKFWVPALALFFAMSPLIFVHPVRVSGISMEPTVKRESIHLVLRAWCAGSPKRGEIWLVESPEGPAIKRVVGLPGEHLEQRLGDLFREGRRIEESYVSRTELHDAGPWNCGVGYLVAGDNRPASHDGRSWGPLPKSAFKGRLMGIGGS